MIDPTCFQTALADGYAKHNLAYSVVVRAGHASSLRDDGSVKPTAAGGTIRLRLIILSYTVRNQR